MAKELPYFKFEPSEWDSGTVQMCSMEAQGLFINLCCLYWSRLGDLPYKLAMQKLCKGYANALQELCDEEILTINEDVIIIGFLDEQLEMFNKKSDKARESAQKRWSKPSKDVIDANALQTESERNAIREEKKREEKNLPLEQRFEGERKVYLDFAIGYYNALKVNNKILDSQSINFKWVDEIRKLCELDGVPMEKMKKVGNFYMGNISNEFAPQAYSTSSFRSKYVQIREFCNKQSK